MAQRLLVSPFTTAWVKMIPLVCAVLCSVHTAEKKWGKKSRTIAELCDMSGNFSAFFVESLPGKLDYKNTK